MDVERGFVRSVFERVKPSTRCGLSEKIIKLYTGTVCALYKNGFGAYLGDPDALFKKLRNKYSKPSTVLPTAVFVATTWSYSVSKYIVLAYP